VASLHHTPVDTAAAADWLLGGGIVLFPTETFYGLAVDPTQPAAVQAVFDLKGRPESLPLPLIGASAAEVERVCGPLVGLTARLADAFWPGPLSLVVDAPPSFAAGVDGGTGTVAVRVPGHEVARAFAARCARLITSTSANRSGQPPATSAGEAARLVEDPRVRVLDGGRTAGGAPSTIVDARHPPVRLVRAGAVAWERVLRSIQE
jgi:L-threonylcarbamoyladenylate synthase